MGYIPAANLSPAKSESLWHFDPNFISRRAGRVSTWIPARSAFMKLVAEHPHNPRRVVKANKITTNK